MSIERVLLRFVEPLRTFRSEGGQTLAEYSIILTLVAVGVVTLAVVFFSTALAGMYDGITACFDGGC